MAEDKSGHREMSPFAKIFVSVAVGLVLACPATAHDTWLLPQRAGVNPGQAVSFDLTSGMAFPANEVGVKPERLARAAARLNGTVSDLTREVVGKKALRLKARFPKPGVAAVWVESKARSLELKPEQVREYLHEIGAWDTVGRKWESGGAGAFREAYTKHAKAYVRVGQADGDDSWREPVGMALELVPESDPTELLAGEEFVVRLFKDGQPVADLGVGLLAAKAKSGSLSKTDSDGRVRLRPDRAGWWLIRATILEPASKPDLDWESRFTTLTIFVGAK